MILVIDNYDSFTYNLVQYLGELKADLQVHRNDQITVDQVRALNPERILVSRGEHGPGETRMRSGLSVRTWSTVIWSLRCTCRSAFSSPRYCTRL